jgi:hypothetical protein
MSYWDRTCIAFSELKGKTLTAIEKTDDTMTFKVDDGSEYEMYHSQDCCESVYIESVVGDLDDLIGEPILVAEEATSGDDPADYKPTSDYRDSFTWTFYKLATRKGYVDLRWLGESNGYYSESVSFARTVDPTTTEAAQ